MPPTDPAGPPPDGSATQSVPEDNAPPQIRYDLAGNPLPLIGSGPPMPEAHKPEQAPARQPYPEPRQVYSAPLPSSSPAQSHDEPSVVTAPRTLSMFWKRGLLAAGGALIFAILLFAVLKAVHHR